MTVELVEWLSAQLDADEAAAKAAGGETWAVTGGDPDDDPWLSLADSGDDVAQPWGDHPREYSVHIAAWDPARVLAEVAAKRRVLAEFQRRDTWLNMKTLVEPARSVATAKRDALVPVIRLLALPYAGRDGYQDSWRPE